MAEAEAAAESPAPAEAEAAAVDAPGASCSGVSVTPSSSIEVTVSVNLPRAPGSCKATMAMYGSEFLRSGSLSSSERRSLVLTLLFSIMPVNSALRAGTTPSAFITHSPQRA